MTYTLIQQFNNKLAHLKFKGPFQGRTVTWDTHFFTLDAYIAEYKITDTAPKQVIDIEPIEKDIMKLTVALNISEIFKRTNRGPLVCQDLFHSRGQQNLLE